MALYSLESPASVKRVSAQVIVADTSYLIPLRVADYSDQYVRNVVTTFHTATTGAGSQFFINVVIRHEQLRDVRERSVITALKSLLASNPAIEKRYKSLKKFETSGLAIDDIVEKHSEYLLKHHIHYGDLALVRNFLTSDLMAEYLAFEKASDLVYFPGSWPDAWVDLGNVINTRCQEPTDAMIVNFANFIEAKAIVTGDVGFALVADDIDVYMPKRLARRCKGIYDEKLDV